MKGISLHHERIHLRLREGSRPHFICLTPQNSRREKKSMVSFTHRILKAKNAVEGNMMLDVTDQWPSDIF